MTIFAAFMPRTYILPFIRSGYYYGYSDAALSKDIRLSIHNGLLLLRCSLFLAECGAIAFLIFILIFRFMPRTMKNYSSVNNSSIDVTSAHDTCTQFIEFLRERYPNLNQIKYKISKNGKHLCLRARYKRRAIHAEGRDFEKTINTFMFYMILKLSIDKYYPTLEEMIEKRPLEPFFVKFNCEVMNKCPTTPNI